VLDAWDNPVAMGLNQDPLYSIEAEGALLTVGEGPAGAPPPTANDKFSRKSTHCNAAREHIVPTIRFRALPTATAARLRVKCEVNVGGTPGGGGGMPRVGGSRLELVAALELELVATNRVVQVFTTPRAAEYASVSCRAGDRPGKVTPQPSPWLPLTLVPVFVVGSASIFIQSCITDGAGFLCFLSLFASAFEWLLSASHPPYPPPPPSTLNSAYSNKFLPSGALAFILRVDPPQVIVCVETEDQSGFGGIGRILVKFQYLTYTQN
jgi:hypothetical protein